MKYIDERFDTFKNITVINGELEPIQTYMSTSDDRTMRDRAVRAFETFVLGFD